LALEKITMTILEIHDIFEVKLGIALAGKVISSTTVKIKRDLSNANLVITFNYKEQVV
jgi:hypothetical protein